MKPTEASNDVLSDTLELSLIGQQGPDSPPPRTTVTFLKRLLKLKLQFCLVALHSLPQFCCFMVLDIVIMGVTIMSAYIQRPVHWAAKTERACANYENVSEALTFFREWWNIDEKLCPGQRRSAEWPTWPSSCPSIVSLLLQPLYVNMWWNIRKRSVEVTNLTWMNLSIDLKFNTDVKGHNVSPWKPDRKILNRSEVIVQTDGPTDRQQENMYGAYETFNYAVCLGAPPPIRGGGNYGDLTAPSAQLKNHLKPLPFCFWRENRFFKISGNLSALCDCDPQKALVHPMSHIIAKFYDRRFNGATCSRA